MRVRFVWVVLGIASSASASPSAEDALATSQLGLGRRRDVMDDQPVDPYVRSAAFAQLAGGGDGGGGAAAGAAVAIGGIGCDIANVSAQGRLRPFAHDGVVTGEVNYGACLSRVALTFAYSGTRGSGLAPSIADRRSLWSRRYSSSYDQLEMGAGEFWNSDHDQGERYLVLPMTFGGGQTRQLDGTDARTIVTLDLDIGVLRYRRLSGFSLETFILTSNALKAGSDDLGGIATAFYPARIGYDTHDVFVHAEAGWGYSGGKITERGSTQVDGKTTSSWTETIDATGLPKMTIFVGNLEAGVRRDRITASAGVSRSFYPTFDGNIAREARISGELAYVAGAARKTKLSLSPFATRTHTWTRDAGDVREVATGAQLHVGRELTKELRIDAIGEAGVSPYARLDRDRAATANNVGGQVLVALSAHVVDFTGTLRRLRD